jgi:ribose-phosphate pyrophosphokinase
MNDLKIFSGPANPALTQDICRYLNLPMGKISLGRFPDGEISCKIDEDVRGRDVFIVQPTCPPVNEHILELLVMIDSFKRASSYRLTAVIPYFGYARQDRKDQPRVPITAKLVANLVVAAGAHRVLTMDLHAQQIQGFFDIPVDHLYAAPVLFDYISKSQVGKQVVVSPDLGGLKMAAAYANALSAELAIVAKRRISPTETEAISVIGEIDGRNILLVDDLTETAGTLVNAAALLKSRGADKIRACVSHTLLNAQGIERLRKSCIDELITTDTVFRSPVEGVNITTISVAGLLGEAIKRIHSNSSVTSLFEFKG